MTRIMMSIFSMTSGWGQTMKPSEVYFPKVKHANVIVWFYILRTSCLFLGYKMTNVGDLAHGMCDGRVAPTFCSGLAVISKHPIIKVKFLPFSVYGGEYESWVRRGAGMVTLEPSPGHTVDIVATSLASLSCNSWYREHQASQLLHFIRQSQGRCFCSEYTNTTLHTRS